MTDQTPATEARICICWIDGFPRGTRHQSECNSYNDGRADALREAADAVRALLDEASPTSAFLRGDILAILDLEAS